MTLDNKLLELAEQSIKEVDALAAIPFPQVKHFADAAGALSTDGEFVLGCLMEYKPIGKHSIYLLDQSCLSISVTEVQTNRVQVGKKRFSQEGYVKYIETITDPKELDEIWNKVKSVTIYHSVICIDGKPAFRLKLDDGDWASPITTEDVIGMKQYHLTWKFANRTTTSNQLEGFQFWETWSTFASWHQQYCRATYKLFEGYSADDIKEAVSTIYSIMAEKSSIEAALTSPTTITKRAKI